MFILGGITEYSTVRGSVNVITGGPSESIRGYKLSYSRINESFDSVKRGQKFVNKSTVGYYSSKYGRDFSRIVYKGGQFERL